MKAYINGRVFTGTQFSSLAVLTDKGMVTGLVEAAAVPAGMETIDLQNNILAPAFIDIQLYSGNGRLFSDELSVAAIQSTYEYCLAGGATQFCITLATNSMDVFYKGIDAVRAYWQQGGKGMPGLHPGGTLYKPVEKGCPYRKIY